MLGNVGWRNCLCDPDWRTSDYPAFLTNLMTSALRIACPPMCIQCTNHTNHASVVYELHIELSCWVRCDIEQSLHNGIDHSDHRTREYHASRRAFGGSPLLRVSLLHDGCVVEVANRVSSAQDVVQPVEAME